MEKPYKPQELSMKMASIIFSTLMKCSSSVCSLFLSQLINTSYSYTNITIAVVVVVVIAVVVEGGYLQSCNEQLCG